MKIGRKARGVSATATKIRTMPRFIWTGNHNGQTKQEGDDILDDADDVGRDCSLYPRHIVRQAAQEFTGAILLVGDQDRLLYSIRVMQLEARSLQSSLQHYVHNTILA